MLQYLEGTDMNGLLLPTPVFLAPLQISMAVFHAVVAWPGASMYSCRNASATARHVLQVPTCIEDNEAFIQPHATLTKRPQ